MSVSGTRVIYIFFFLYQAGLVVHVEDISGLTAPHKLYLKGMDFLKMIREVQGDFFTLDDP